jgi:hypothetical protein
MATIDRGPWNALVDDDGSNLVGTVWNKDKIKTVILDPTDAALVPTDAALAALGTWTTYTPVFGGPSGPTLGNGQLFGRYVKTGKWVEVVIILAFGSTSTSGTGGYWTWTLPFAPVVRSPLQQEVTFLVGIINSGGISSGPSIGYLFGGVVYVVTGAGSPVGPGVPSAWGAGAILSIRGSYETAT